MMDYFWDSAMVSSIAFQPRRIEKGQVPPPTPSGTAEVVEGDLVLPDGTNLGYCLVKPAKLKAVALLFHGNAELCTNISFCVEQYSQLQLAVLCVDYRGYGWSGGSACFSKLCPDAAEIAHQLPSLLQKHGLVELPVVVWGRSIGALSAAFLGSTEPSTFVGVIIESGLMTVKDLPILAPMMQLVPGGSQLFGGIPEPVDASTMMSRIRQPVLIMHGTDDEIVPVSQGMRCYQQCASSNDHKRLVSVPGYGHNDLFMYPRYWAVIDEFLQFICYGTPFGGGSTPASPGVIRPGNGNGGSPLNPAEVPKMSISDLKTQLRARNLDFAGCVEKDDLVRLLVNHLSSATS